MREKSSERRRRGSPGRAAISSAPASPDRTASTGKISAYDAQQAAEKALKALLLHRNIPFRFVHDLGELLNLLVQADIEMPEGLLEAAELTEYAVEARYPGPFEPVSEEEHRRALELATAVVDWVASEIERESP